MSLRVIVVDDDPDNALMMARLLEQMFGCDVTICHDGPACIDAVQRLRPLVAFVDLQMPVMRGDEVARALRQPGMPPVRLVAITGYGGDEYRRLCIEAGFDHFEVKPLSIFRAGELISLAAQQAETPVPR